jgi:hypothetical protein
MAATPLTTITAVSPYGSGPGPGVAPAVADTGNGNSFVNDGRTYLLAANADSVARALTIQGKSFSVPAERSVVLGPFPVFQQHGSTVTVTGTDTDLTFVAFSASADASAKR